MTRIAQAAWFSTALLGLVWAVFIVVDHGLNIRFGVIPRTEAGLIAIPLAAFFHANLHHILANSVPLFVLGFLFALDCESRIKAVWLTLALSTLGGAVVWCIGARGFHLGASLLIFAFFGYLVGGLFFSTTRGRLNLLRVGLALATLALYGTLFFAFFRFDAGVSWAAHFCGAVAGFALRRITA